LKNGLKNKIKILLKKIWKTIKRSYLCTPQEIKFIDIMVRKDKELEE
jgi:hypothetical protein